MVNVSFFIEKMFEWRADWNRFAYEALGVRLDREQREILRAVQNHKRVSVASGTARGKDYVAAVSAVCFMYLTPKIENGALIENTKIALTAPTGRQVRQIMMPEIARIMRRANERLSAIGGLEGEVLTYGIKTRFEEWFLTGFKADEYNHEAWSGFHAVNTMFIVTEASGISETVFNAIEGNLQGNSRILLVFNPNTPTGYASESQKSKNWKRFRLSSLTAPNIIEKKSVIAGQVDYDWVIDKLNIWCAKIDKEQFISEEDDFEFEGQWYRPNDLFRVKVLGKFPKVSEDMLIPQQWIELANKRWKEANPSDYVYTNSKLIVGSDIAGMGRDDTVECHRYSDYVQKFVNYNSGGKANHMQTAGQLANLLRRHNTYVSIDTIGEGAGVYSRLIEQGFDNVVSCKYSERANNGNSPLKDVTSQYEFANMRAYLFWAVRDWLNPANGSKAMLPPDADFMNEATNIKWQFTSSGKIQIESKDDIKKRIGKSTDKFDSLANTFYPIQEQGFVPTNILW